MSQISRPFQIALVAMGLFIAVWFTALRSHPSATSGPAAPVAAAAAPSSAPGEKTPSPAPAYTGPAPGVAGLTRAITKAHEAVTESQLNAKQLSEKSAQASALASTGGSSSEAAAGSQKTAVVPPASKPSVAASRPNALAKKPATGSSKVPPKQLIVERALKHGGVAVVLFWSPNGLDDLAVRREMQALRAAHISVQEAPASQVASFGTITRSIRVTGTPTILIINRRGQTTTITGLTDAYSIQQAIAEARRT